MRRIKKIIVHCSDSDFGCSDLINQWHKERGWAGIGYHYVITNGRFRSWDFYEEKLDGVVQIGRRESIVGAHCRGHNMDSLGICLIGKETFTDKQTASLLVLLDLLAGRHGVSTGDILGHTELNPGKTCPNFEVEILRAQFDERRRDDS